MLCNHISQTHTTIWQIIHPEGDVEGGKRPEVASFAAKNSIPTTVVPAARYAGYFCSHTF